MNYPYSSGSLISLNLSRLLRLLKSNIETGNVNCQLFVYFSVYSREQSQHTHRLSTVVGVGRGVMPGTPNLENKGKTPMFKTLGIW